jgi:hypothetical protein
MKMLLLSMLLLVGCAGQVSPQYRAFEAYVAEKKPLAEAGSLKWSVYYTGLYDKAVASSAPPYVLHAINESVMSAVRYEKGELSKEEFDYSRRQQQIAAQANGAVAQRQAQIDQERRQQQAYKNIETAAKIMQDSQPRPLR